MKYLLLASSIFISTSAMASFTEVLLEKKEMAGHISLPENKMSSICQVYYDRIEVTRYAGNAGGTVLESKVVKPVQLLGDVNQLINNAYNQAVDSNIGPTDVPSTQWKAVRKNDLGEYEDVILFHDGIYRITREGSEAVVLKNYLDQNC